MTNGGTDWVAIGGGIIALYAAVVSTWKVVYDRRKDQAHVAIDISRHGEDRIQVAVVNDGHRPLYVMFAGTRERQLGGTTGDHVKVPFEYYGDSSRPRPLQPLEPILYSLPIERFRARPEANLSVYVETSKGKTFAEPFPQDWLPKADPSASGSVV